MAKGIEVGLIGYGGWAREAYVPGVLDDPGVKIGAAAARTDETLAAARRDLGGSVELFKDFRELLGRPEIDAVMIGAPRPVNARIAIAAIEAGKHMWVEPPFADGEETDELLERAAGSGTVFHADLELRYLPVVAAIRELTGPGPLGELRSARVELSNDWGNSPADDRHMGATVAGLSTWYVDLIDALFEETPGSIEVRGGEQMKAGSALIRYERGRSGELAFDLTRPGWDLRLRVEGAEGKAEANLMDGEYRYAIGGSGWISRTANCDRPEYGFVGMRESVAVFFAAVRGEAETASGPVTYRRLHRILTEVTRQAVSHVHASHPD